MDGDTLVDILQLAFLLDEGRRQPRSSKQVNIGGVYLVGQDRT